MKNKLLSISIFILMACGLFLSALPGAEIVPLKYRKHPAKPESFFPSGYATLTMQMKSPPGEWLLPEMKSEIPLYTMLKIGEKENLLILDSNQPGEKFFQRLYFDANGNRDLTDDPIIEAFPQLQENYFVLFLIDTQIEIDGTSLPFSFYLSVAGIELTRLKKSELTEAMITQYFRPRVRTNCAYTGEMTIDRHKYQVFLNDKNCNGRFNDKFSLQENTNPELLRPQSSKGDELFISPDGKIESFDVQACGDMLLLGDKLFHVEISTAQGNMTLTPVTKNLATLKLAAPVERLFLYSEDGQHTIVIYRPGKTIKIPPGKYRIFTYQMFKQDKQGDLWRLCAGATSETPFFTLTEDKAATLEIGEPFIPDVKAYLFPSIPSKKKPGLKQAMLIFNIEGNAKEFVTDLSHISGDLTQITLSEARGTTHRPMEPTYTIIKEDGEVMTQGAFRYG